MFGRQDMEGVQPAIRRHHVGRAALAVFIGYFLLGAAWGLAGPFDGSADEQHHIVRAAGVVRGQVFAPLTTSAWHTGTMQVVPSSLVRGNCFWFAADKNAACDHDDHSDQTMVSAASATGRYNPVFYFVSGLPLRWLPTMTGVTLSRLINAGLIAALIALAASAALRWSRHRVMLAGTVLLATPALMNLAGVVNPSGVEIASGVLLFTALSPLLDPDRPVERRMVHYAGLAAVVLATVRALGPFWLGVALLVLIVTSSRARLAELAKMPLVRWWAAAVSIAVLASLAWTVHMHTLQLGRPDQITPPYTLVQILYYLVLSQWPNYLSQMVAGLGYLDVPVPTVVPVLWAASVVLLIGSALLFGRRVDRLRIGLILLVVFGTPTVTDTVGANTYDYPTQGRYLMPLFAGAVLLSAEALARAGVWDGRRSRAVVRGFGLVVMPALQLICLTAAMVRWQSGASYDARRPHVNPLAGPWHPAVGSLLPLEMAVVAVIVIAYCYWSMAEPRSAEEPAAASAPAAPEGASVPAPRTAVALADARVPEP
jgi:hypothetical protein